MQPTFSTYVFGIIFFSFGGIQLQTRVVGAISTEKFLTLTLSQKIALDKFREKVQPILTNDYMKQDTYLIRWLRARNFNLNSAEEMLQQNLKWRSENKIDTIHLEDWKDMTSDYHMTIDTNDKIGQPIGTIDMNYWDIRRGILQGKGQRLLRFCTNLVENITRQVIERQQKGVSVTQAVVLMNAEGFNVVQHACALCIPLWIQFTHIIEDYYPEWLDEFIIVDSPPAVQIVLNAIRPFLSKNTNEAIKVFEPNKSKWMKYLDQKISKEERRKQYGGTKPPIKF